MKDHKNGLDHVPETLIGKWFLRSPIWTHRVLEVALQDLETLFPKRNHSYPVVVDVGCGYGRSMGKLFQRFQPSQLIALDVDETMVQFAVAKNRNKGVPVVGAVATSAKLALADNSVDLLFCHQTFHHLIHQEQAITEFFRVLKPGGVLLFAESTKRYIHSWMIRLFFRHPMDVQKTAEEYLELIRKAGFLVDDTSISYPYLWWSREDFGILENWFKISPPPFGEREETLVNLVATKPSR